MRIVVALGGNALLERGEAPDSDIQESHVRRAAEALSPLGSDHDLIVTHGNGPQVGVLAIESASDPSLSHPYPFDSLVAETQGLIGNWLLQAVERAIPVRRAVCLLTRTVVAVDDPAFQNPTKFVGPIYPEVVAKKLATERGWEVRRDGYTWRRVVPSPEPRDIVELEDIRLLLNRGGIVICAGGGGIPVVRDSDGSLRGVEAVVDKDLTAALLATAVGADALLLLTDVANVELDYGTPRARAIGSSSVADMREHSFAAGSMGPKVEAACRFVEHTGGEAAIGRLEDAALLLSGAVGTVITRGGARLTERPPDRAAPREQAPDRISVRPGSVPDSSNPRSRRSER
jgi:carbamate kinase